MAYLHFEDLEVGDSSSAGPYLVSKDEIIQFAKRYDVPYPKSPAFPPCPYRKPNTTGE